MIHATEKPFHCSHCDRSFNRKGHLKEHRMIHTNERPFHCSHCDRSFTRRGPLKEHTMIHTNEKPFHCSHCDKSFTQKKCLKRHEMIHTNEKPFQCSHCDKSFTQRSDLKRHEMIHTNEKPFQCSHCDKSFTLKNNLKIHIITIHINEKPSSCSHCGRSFTLKNNLKRHMMMIHTNEEPFRCSHCDRSFTCKGYLEKHMMIHTNNKPFSRSDCGRSFNHRISLKRRMIIHKNGKLNLSLVQSTATRRFVQVRAEHKETSIASLTSKSFIGDDREKNIFMDTLNTSSLSRNLSFFKEESLENCLVIHKQNESPSSSHCSQLPSREESGLQLEGVPCVDNSFVCSLCRQSFLEKEGFENHILAHTPDESPTFASSPESHLVQGKDLQAQPIRDCSQLFICPSCNQSFLEKEALEKCLLIHEIGQSLFDSWVLIKNYCHNSSNYSPLEEIKIDTVTQIIPSNEQSFLCSKCSQFFSEKEALEKHKFLYHFSDECESLLNISYSSLYLNSVNDGETSIREIQTSLKFHWCSQKCTEKAALKSLTIRISRSPFCCADCGHLFSEMKSLKKHVMIHENSKRKSYSCSNCNHSFTRKSVLETHSVIHTVTPRYPCLQCSQSFTRKSELKKHAKLCCNRECFTCSCCKQSFSYKRVLKKHIMMSHQNQEILSSLSNCQLFIAETKLTEHEVTDLGKGTPSSSHLHSGSNNCVYQESNSNSVLQESPNLDLNSQTSNFVLHGLTNSDYQKNASAQPNFENICNPNPEDTGHIHRKNTDSVSSHNIENATAEKLFSCFLCEQPFFEKDNSKLLSMVYHDEKHHTCPSCTHLFTELSMIRDNATSAVANSVHEESTNFDLHSEISDCIQQEKIGSCSVS